MHKKIPQKTGVRHFLRKRIVLPVAMVCGSGGLYGWNSIAPVEYGLSYKGEARVLEDAAFFSDESWIDAAGQRQIRQSIFDEVIELIGGAQSLVLMDMFLFNDWQGPSPEKTRDLSREITEALLKKREQCPDCRMVVISDPINTVYGGTQSTHFDQLSAAGIEVVETRLEELNDSNPVYSFIWYWFIRPWGNSPANTVPNPLGPGKVTIRSYLEMINFKANHRKTLVVGNKEGTYTAVITSANPHDGSSAHRNIAVRFSGLAAMDVISSENAVLRLSNHDTVALFKPVAKGGNNEDTITLLTERQIKEAVLKKISSTVRGDTVKLLMFYLSDRDIIDELTAAANRGVSVRVILDVNKDAFGREKNGVPNRPVAHELVQHDVEVRWCETSGEQCHAKMLLVQSSNRWAMIQGSANFTRRNLNNYNLESDILIEGSVNTKVLSEANELFEKSWANAPDRRYSAPYANFKDESFIKKMLYRFMEASGLSTF